VISGVNIKMGKISDFFTKKPTKNDQESAKMSNSSQKSQNDQVNNEFLTKVKTEVEENSNVIESLPKMREYRVILRDIRHDIQNKEIGTTQEVKHDPEKQFLIILKPQKIIKPHKPIKIEEAIQDDSKTDQLQCQICKKKFNNVINLNRHKNIHNKKFGCKLCGKKYPIKYMLLNHIKNVHENPASFKCDICNAELRSKYSFLNHQKVHMKNRQKPFKCDKCSYATDNKSSLQKHLKTHERIIERCDKCNKILLNYITHDCRLDCKFCGLKFSHKETVTKHIKKYHAYEIERSFYECDICGSKFNRKLFLRIHMNKKHADGKIQTFTCDLDEKTFKEKGKLAQHMKSHLPSVKCDFCFKKVNIRNLRGHIKSFHTGIKQPSIKRIRKIKNLQCPICSKILISKQGFNLHISDHNKKLKCKLCDKLFGSQTNLKAHIRIYHENLYRFSCEICERKFTLRSSLKGHMKIHDPNRPRDLKCSQCAFATDNKVSFKAHLNSHKWKNAEIAAMKNPFKCSQCPSVLKSQRYLNRHIIRVHPKVLFECDICGRMIKTKRDILTHFRGFHKILIIEKCKFLGKQPLFGSHN